MKHISLIFFSLSISLHCVFAVQILSKSKLEKCEKVSEYNNLNCTTKIIINMAVPSESSGREASMVAELVEVEENSTNSMRNLRIPPVITVNKSAAYALYDLTYIRDVAYKPEELYVKTRKCEPDAGSDVVKACESCIARSATYRTWFIPIYYLSKNRSKNKSVLNSELELGSSCFPHLNASKKLELGSRIHIWLRDENGHIIEHTQPTCCPCGDQRRVPSSCGSFFDKMMKGKANTAHCLRFPGDWFHVFGIGKCSVGFTVRIEVKTGSKVSEVVVGPANRTVTSHDNFLRVNLIGDYVGYTNIPSFENNYLVIPRQGGPGQPQTLGSNFSMWMLLERVRFTLDGLECNKIGVGYEAFNGQPDFCSSPFWSCLHNQLWNFWDADQNRISRKQVPLYGVQGRFERINQHPNAGTHSFSIGITEVLNTDLLIELSADDIEYVYQRSPGKILSITVPSFEALTQFGTATITTKNVGEVEASYSLTFDCSAGVSQMEELFYIMKAKEVAMRSFKLYPMTDQAAKYVCAAILKDSDFNEVDRAECQFTTTATVLENGSQIPFQPPKSTMNGFFESIEDLWNRFWVSLADFLTGKTCRRQCSSFFDFSCHIQYICISWIIMFSLLLAIFPTVIVLLWLLHQKGLFDPLYDWWDDHFSADKHRIGDIWNHGTDANLTNLRKHHRQERRHHKHDTQKNCRSIHREHGQNYSEQDTDYHYYLHHVHKNKHKHGRTKSSRIIQKVYMEKGGDKNDHCRSKKKRGTAGQSKMTRHYDEIPEEYYKHKHSKMHA